MFVFTPSPKDTPDTPIQPALVGRSEASQMLRISLRKLDYLVKDGTISCRKIGRRVLFALEDIRQFIERMKPE